MAVQGDGEFDVNEDEWEWVAMDGPINIEIPDSERLPLPHCPRNCKGIIGIGHPRSIQVKLKI